MKTVIIGLGNPVLTDDAAGIKVIRILQQRLSSGQATPSADLKEVYAGGLCLLNALCGYKRAIIVDAMVSGQAPPGTICCFNATELHNLKNLGGHDVDLVTALEIGRMLDMQLPVEIMIWGIEAGDMQTFSEELTEAVNNSVYALAEKFLCEVSDL